MLNLLQSQLAFFGAIDEAVLYAKEGQGNNPDAVLRTVGALLPGTTGFGQAGWYGELQDFANRSEVRNPDFHRVVTFPSVEQALEYLQAETPEQRMSLATAALRTETPSEPTPRPETEPPSPPPPPAPDSATTPAVLPERDAESSYTPYHDPVFARSAYAAMVLARIAGLGGMPPGLAGIADLPEQIMSAALTSWGGPGAQFDANTLLSQADTVNSRDEWRLLAAAHVDQKFADQSLPCFGMIEEFGGQYCSTLYTETTDDDLTVDNIRKILDPRNWKLYSKFFCSVTEQKPALTQQGWARLLETIGPECAEWRMQTALLFYYANDGSGGIFLNYDLDPQRDGDSGMVEVDNGYIWITPLNGDPSQKGVKICTSKQERVQGLSPTATAALGCLLGWGTAANDLLSGTAKMVLKNASVVTVPFTPTQPNGNAVLSGVGQPVAGPAQLPPDFGHAMGDVRTLINHQIDRSRDIAAMAGDRWMKGMQLKDVKDITDEFGTYLKAFAVEAYKTAESNVKPQMTPTNEDGA